MTLLDAESKPAAEASAPPRGRRRLSVEAIVLIAIGGLLVLGLVGWWIWSAVAASAVAGVRVAYDAQPITCEGTRTGLVPDDENPEFLERIIEFEPGMACQLRVQVVNDGWSEVTVTAVGLLEMGPENAYGLIPLHVNPNGLEVLETPEVNAAFFDIMGGIALPAGQLRTFTAFFAYEGGALMDECTLVGWNPPVVVVTALGATGEAQPAPENTIWFVQGSIDECADEAIG